MEGSRSVIGHGRLDQRDVGIILLIYSQQYSKYEYQGATTK